jgi:glycosyltransferase involved in cell wall biosynthesis
MRPLLYFVAIVKNEASNFRATIESVKDVVDGIVVLDTGSTDGTQDIVRAAAGNVPCKLYEEPFVDFATSRNRVLELAEADAPVFTLMLSGDETLHNGKALRDALEKERDTDTGGFTVELRNDLIRWLYTRVLRTDAKWRYVGVVHEVPKAPDGTAGGKFLPGAYVVHSASDPERRTARVRNYDLPMLLKMEAEAKTDEERGRALLFLANTYDALSEQEDRRKPGSAWITYKMTAMSYYRRRSELGGDLAERNDALFHYLNSAETLGMYSHQELLSRLVPLAEMDPKRPEVRYMIAAHTASIDLKRGIDKALESAKVAKEAKSNPNNHMPIDSRVEWLSYRIAAACAKDLRRATAFVHELANKGLEAGGPAQAFEEFLR